MTTTKQNLKQQFVFLNTLKIILVFFCVVSNAEFCWKQDIGTLMGGRNYNAIGDVNKDGLTDYYIGTSDQGIANVPHKVQIIFGRTTPFPTNYNLSNLSPPDGVIISSIPANGYFGFSAGPAGDWNGDGIDDFMVSDYLENFSTTGGAVYVIFGRLNANWANFDIGTGFVSGVTGQKFIAGIASGYLGVRLGRAYDYNSDGKKDLLLPVSTSNTANQGVFVVYGGRTSFNDITLSSLPAAEGFKITKTGSGSVYGYGNDAIGDFDGDGKEDYIICSNSGTGKPCYILFGRTDANVGFDITTVTYPIGIKITSTETFFGFTLTKINFNGDAYMDVLIGARSGAGYVFFGSAAPTNIDTATMTTAQGVKFTDSATSFGFYVQKADLNNDGYEDAIVSGGDSSTSPVGIFYGSASPVNVALTSSPSDTIGMKVSSSGRNAGNGFLVADIDNDGKLELYAQIPKEYTIQQLTSKIV